jgi:hypothetical protein
METNGSITAARYNLCPTKTRIGASKVHSHPPIERSSVKPAYSFHFYSFPPLHLQVSATSYPRGNHQSTYCLMD